MHFKFLNSTDVDRVLIDGTLMVSALGYFRKLELGEIGDPLEGASRWTVNEAMVVAEGSKELDVINAGKIFGNTFAKVEGGGQINIAAGVSFVQHLPEFYIYSFSIGDLGPLSEEMCVQATKPYDACLRIKDPAKLAIACLQQGVIRNLDDQPAADLFEHVGMKQVEYVVRASDVTEGPALSPDPYKKEERFKPQSEMRFLFIPFADKPVPKERLIFAIPNVASHFELVFRDRPKS